MTVARCRTSVLALTRSRRSSSPCSGTRRRASRGSGYAAITPPRPGTGAPGSGWTRPASTSGEHLVVTGAWWDVVDDVARHLVGDVLRPAPPGCDTSGARVGHRRGPLAAARSGDLPARPPGRHRPGPAPHRHRGQRRRPVVLAAQGASAGRSASTPGPTRTGSAPRWTGWATGSPGCPGARPSSTWAVSSMSGGRVGCVHRTSWQGSVREWIGGGAAGGPARPADRGHRLRGRGAAAPDAQRGARTCGCRCWSGPRARSPAPTGSPSCSRSRSSPRSSRRPAGSSGCWRPGSRWSRATWPTYPTLPSDIDAVVHCAGDVSFDPPVDEGFTTNVIGVRDLLDRIDEAQAATGRRHPLRAHLDGVRRGPAPRQHPRGARSSTTSTSRPSSRGGSAQRQAVEDRSRGVDVLIKERKKAEKEHSRAGLLTAARATEAAPQAVGQGRAGPDRHRAGPQPGLDRLLHVHQGDGRAGRRALGRP